MGDEDSKENFGDSPQRRWPEILQPCPKTVTDTNLPVGEEMETHHMNPLGKAGKTAGRSEEGTLQKDLGRVDQHLEGHLIEAAKTPSEVLLRHFPLQDRDTDPGGRVEYRSCLHTGPEVAQVCPQKVVVGSCCGEPESESQRQILLGLRWSMTR